MPWATVAASAFTAVLWFVSAIGVKTPIVFNNPGVFLVSESTPRNVESPFTRAWRKQSRWNAAGATCAALAAVFQAITTGFGIG